MKLSTDQPPNAAWAILFDCGEGRLYVTPAVNACGCQSPSCHGLYSDLRLSLAY
jgi:hypothetical protein